MKINTFIGIPKCNLNRATLFGEARIEDISASTNTPSNISGGSAHLCVYGTDFGLGDRMQVLTLPRTTPKQYLRYTLDNGNNIYGALANAGAWQEYHFVGQTYASNFIPDATNTRNLGSSSVTWANIYTQNAVTVVSDRNAKNSIQAIDDRVLDAWSEVEQKQYKLNGDDNWSFGYIAQDIVDAFTRHGLDYKQYNIVHEEDGKFMLKYDMCAVLESALNRRYNTGVDR
ncbi:MAG: hypothetical protein [Caudoviricetes sp.]|nr:MAG: hypothetical protein [Caudoviricetes sp.]